MFINIECGKYVSKNVVIWIFLLVKIIHQYKIITIKSKTQIRVHKHLPNVVGSSNLHLAILNVSDHDEYNYIKVTR